MNFRRAIASVGIILALHVLVLGPNAYAVVMRLIHVKELIGASANVFTVKVDKLDPIKLSMEISLDKELKGKAPIDKSSVVDLSPKKSAALDEGNKVNPCFANGNTIVVFQGALFGTGRAFGYTNGAWFHMFVKIENDKTVLQYRRCEPYMRRTFCGSEADLIQIVTGAKAAPAPDPNVKPGPGLKPGWTPPAGAVKDE